MSKFLSPISRRNIAKILPFGIIWLVLGVVFLFIEYAALGDFDNAASSAISPDIEILLFASIAVTIVGLAIGTIELVWLNKALSKRSFTIKIVYKLLFYATFLFIIILISFPIAASMELKVGIFDIRVWNKYLDFLTSLTSISTFVQLGVSLFISLFYAEISDNIGHNVLLNFFSGKYHHPVEEKRIFMFLDMKSSTTIAEKLGHIKYFELLKEYYSCLSDTIVSHYGEVYQYIGDEIVISWQFDKGIMNNNFLYCFFGMQAALQNRSALFKSNFGIIPSFKAGLHYGMVTTGEIGALKKEIIFTGDVLNTTARIQGLCNNYKTDCILSEKLYQAMSDPTQFIFKPLGEVELKGRVNAISLLSVHLAEQAV